MLGRQKHGVQMGDKAEKEARLKDMADTEALAEAAYQQSEFKKLRDGNVHSAFNVAFLAGRESRDAEYRLLVKEAAERVKG